MDKWPSKWLSIPSICRIITFTVSFPYIIRRNHIRNRQASHNWELEKKRIGRIYQYRSRSFAL
jgi:hypothetical protein